MPKSKKMPATPRPSASRRFTAWLIDWFLTGMLTGIAILATNFILSGSFYNAEGYARLFDSDSILAVLLENLISLCLLGAYYIGIPLLGGGESFQTLGMRARRLQIVRQDGDPVGWRELLLRNMVCFVLLQNGFTSYSGQLQELLLLVLPSGVVLALSWTSLAVGAVSCGMILFSARHCGIQDIVSDTCVKMMPEAVPIK